MSRPLQDDIELIERYFDNALSAEETGELKDRLRSDLEFQKLYDREKLLVNTIRFEAARRDLEYLKDIEKHLSSKSAHAGKRAWYYVAAAASVALLVLVILAPWSPADPQALYAENFEVHPNVFEPTMRGQAAPTSRGQAFQAYEQGDYARASALFTDALRDKEDAGALMLLGNANLMIGETGKAKENFQKLINNFDDLDTAGKWYLSLAHLKDGETAEAAARLHEVAASSSPYAAKARDLLKDLE